LLIGERHSAEHFRAKSVPKMAVIHLTDLGIRSLKVGTYFDERTPAFGIRVGKNTKTWIVLKEPNRTKLRIGHYPSLSLADARKKALVALGSPHEASTAPTFPKAREQYLSQGQWRPHSRYEITRTLNRHFHWTKTIDKISSRDITEAIEKIEASSEAAHAFKDIRSLFNWCVPRYIKISPCAGLKPPARYIPRERVLTDEELCAVWRAAEAMNNIYGTTICLLILLGQRIGETSKINKEWIDKDLNLTIPAAITKNGKQHTIPVPKMAAPLIEKLGPFVGYGKCKARLDKISGVTNWTHHDLRRTYATNMQKLGVRLEVTEMLLNHVSGSRGGIVGVYQRHTYTDEMRAAVSGWEKRLTQLFAHAGLVS